jgi:flavin reductase (DIM6/NTAB) family NADH-FMN oxidoreductase RutF
MINVPLANFPRLLHPFNATLVSTKGRTGPPNVLAIAWIMPLSTNPPKLVFAIRRKRHSYTLLEETKEFIVNIAGFDLAGQVLYCGRKSGKNVQKFKAAGLTAGRAKKVGVPIVSECVAHIECRVAETILKGDHVLVIGDVLTAYVQNYAFKELYNLKRFKPLLYLGNDVFTTTSTKTIEPKLQK